MTIDWEKRYGFSGSPTAEWWAQVAENGKAHLILQEFPGDPLISGRYGWRRRCNMEELIEFSIVAYEMGLSDEKAMKFFKEFGKGLVMYEGNLMSVAHAEQLKSLHKDWIAVAHMFITI